MITATTSKPVEESSSDEIAEPFADSGEILDLIVERVWLCLRRRFAWLESLGVGCDSSPQQPLTIDPDDFAAEREWREKSDIGLRWTTAIGRIEKRIAGTSGSHLQHLAVTFGLIESDLDLLQFCVAVHLDPSLGPAFAKLSGCPSQGYVTDALVRQVLDYGREPLWDSNRPLAIWKLINASSPVAGEPQAFAIDPVIPAWLCGRLSTSQKLGGVLRRVGLREPLPDWPLEQVVKLLQRNSEGKGQLRIVIEGPGGSGRATCAAIAASKLGFDSVTIDTGGVSDEGWEEVFLEAQRLALLGAFVLIWRGDQLSRRWSGHLTATPIQVIVCEPNQELAACSDWIDFRIPLPEPSVEERRRLWKLTIPESVAWSESDTQALAERYRLTPGEIISVSRRGTSCATEAAELARETMRHRLGDLGKLIPSPFIWDDLVLPEDLHQALQDFAFEARTRIMFWENPKARELFPRGTGLTALLDGPSGTGKTMTAQVIAAELGFDLIRIDMARVVSKYIGETAKHLSQIFARAARMSAVLLFDEADSLFAKRTEVKDSHDRHANTDTSYLLQLLEEFEGVAILTTNKKGNVDPAFLRRIRYLYDFPKPEARERRRIWRKVIQVLGDVDTEQRLGGTLDQLAGGTAVSGAQIKNAALAAVFIARRQNKPLDGTHLLAGLDRELGKEGRSVGVRERSRLSVYAH